ncbi:MAG: hypothetical protein U1E05_17695, partial [Patescibacteria group bacterium]|nr:hypothetical protein [Patescibacteria group bacterium]
MTQLEDIRTVFVWLTCFGVVLMHGENTNANEALPPHASARLGSVAWRQGAGWPDIVFLADGKLLASATEGPPMSSMFPGDIFSDEMSRDEPDELELERSAIRLWDISTGCQIGPLRGHTVSPGRLAVSPNGRWLASGGWDQTVRIWDMHTATQRFCLKGHPAFIHSLAASRDGKWIASASGNGTPGSDIGEIRVWHADSGECHLALTELKEEPIALAFSADGKTLSAGCCAGVIRCWDIPSGRSSHFFKVPASGPPAGDGIIRSLHYSLDGSTIATVGPDWSIRFWTANEFTLKRTIRPKGESRTCKIAFSPDGRLLASVSEVSP